MQTLSQQIYKITTRLVASVILVFLTMFASTYTVNAAFPGACPSLTTADIQVTYGDIMQGGSQSGSLDNYPYLPPNEQIDFSFSTNDCFAAIEAYFYNEIDSNSYHGDPDSPDNPPSYIWTTYQVYDSNNQSVVTSENPDLLGFSGTFADGEYRLTVQYRISFYDPIEAMYIEEGPIVSSPTITFNVGTAPQIFQPTLPSIEITSGANTGAADLIYAVSGNEGPLKLPLPIPAAIGTSNSTPTFSIAATPYECESQLEDCNPWLYEWALTRDPLGTPVPIFLQNNTFQSISIVDNNDLIAGDYQLSVTVIDPYDDQNTTTTSIDFTIEFVDPPYFTVTPRENTDTLSEIYAAGEYCIDVSLNYGGYQDEWLDQNLNTNNSISFFIAGTGVLTPIQLTTADFNPIDWTVVPESQDETCIDLDTLYNKFMPVPLDVPTIYANIAFDAGYTNVNNFSETNFSTTQTSLAANSYDSPFDGIGYASVPNPFGPFAAVQNATSATISFNNSEFPEGTEFSLGKIVYNQMSNSYTYQLYNPTTKTFVECTANNFGVYACNYPNRPLITESSFLLQDTSADFFTQKPSYQNSYFILVNFEEAEPTLAMQFAIMPTYLVATDQTYATPTTSLTIGAANYILFRDPSKSYNGVVDQTVTIIAYDLEDLAIGEFTLTEDGDTGVFKGTTTLSFASANTDVRLSADSNTSTVAMPTFAKYDPQAYFYNDSTPPMFTNNPYPQAEVIDGEEVFNPYYQVGLVQGLYQATSTYYLKLAGNYDLFGNELMAPLQTGLSALVYIQDKDAIYNEPPSSGGGGPRGGGGDRPIGGLDEQMVLSSDQSFPVDPGGGGDLPIGFGPTIYPGLTFVLRDMNNPETDFFKTFTSEVLQNGWNRVNIAITDFGDGEISQISLGNNRISDWSISTLLNFGTNIQLKLTDMFFNFMPNGVEIENSFNTVLGSQTPSNQGTTSGSITPSPVVPVTSQNSIEELTPLTNEPPVVEETSPAAQTPASETPSANDSTSATSDSDSETPQTETPEFPTVDPEEALKYVACGNQLLFNLGTGQDLDSDGDGCSDAIERTTGTNPLIAEPYACSAFTLANAAACQVSERLEEDDLLLINLNADPTQLPGSQFIIPGTVQLSSDDSIKDQKVCFQLKGSFDFDLGCQEIDSFSNTNNYKLYNFAHFATQSVLEGTYNLIATLTTTSGKVLSDTKQLILGVPSTIPIELVEFSGKQASTLTNNLSDPNDRNSPIIIKANKIKRGEDIYATFKVPYGYQVTGYFNSVVLTAAALSDSSTGYATIKVPQWFDLGSESYHRLLAYAYDVTDPSVISQAIIVEFEGPGTSYWMLILLIAAVLFLILAVFKLNKYLKSKTSLQDPSSPQTEQPMIQSSSAPSTNTTNAVSNSQAKIITDQDLIFNAVPLTTPSSSNDLPSDLNSTSN